MLLQQATILPIQNTSPIIQIMGPTITPSFWPTILSDNWMTVASVLISLLAFSVVIYQTEQNNRTIKITQEEIYNRSRPWIGVSHVNFYAPDMKMKNPTVNIEFEYTNFGDLPAINFNPNVKWSTEIIDFSDNIESDHILSLMPKQLSYIGIEIPFELYGEIEASKKQLYVLVSFLYKNTGDGEKHHTKILYKYHVNAKVLNTLKSDID